MALRKKFQSHENEKLIDDNNESAPDLINLEIMDFERLEFDLYQYWAERERDSIDESQLINKPSSPPKNNEVKKIVSPITYYDKDVTAALNAVDEELFSSYGFKINSEQNEDVLGISIDEILSPRLRFLLQKRRYLKALYDEEKKQISQNHDEENKKKKSKLASISLTSFNIGKKIVDIGDDVWSATRRFLSAEIVDKWNPFLIGGTVGIINAVEAVLGLKRAYKAYKDTENKKGQRYSRIVVGVATFMLGGAGTGLAISLVASAFGASVLAIEFMPVIIPACLFVIYNLSLFRKSYTFHQTKKQEEEAKNAYYDCLKQNKNKLDRLHQLRAQLREERDKIYEHIIPVLEKVKFQKEHGETIHLSEEERPYYNRYCDYLKKQDQCDQAYYKLQKDIHPLREKYQRCHEKRLDAERKVAINTVEVVASALVLSGIILGSVAIFGAASVASFGMVPLALIVTGVAVGFSLKILEFIDSKLHHKITNGIRNFFTNAWDNIFHKKSKNQLENLHESDKDHGSENKTIYNSTTASLYSSALQSRLVSKDNLYPDSSPSFSAPNHVYGEMKRGNSTSSLWASQPEQSAEDKKDKVEIKPKRKNFSPNSCCIV